MTGPGLRLRLRRRRASPPAPPLTPRPCTQPPAKRLRQLESVSGRGLLLGCGDTASIKGAAPATAALSAASPAAHYVSVAARCCGGNGDDDDDGSSSGGGASWRLVYRSEAVGGTCNPEWRPLGWDEQLLLLHDPLLDSTSAQVLLTLHAVEAPEAVAAGGEGALALPVLYAAASRPAFQIEPAACGVALLAPPHTAMRGDDGGGGSSIIEEAVSCRPPAANGDQQQQQQWHQQLLQNGTRNPPSASQSSLVDSALASAAAAAATAGDSGAWLEAAGAALAGTGCCPGRTVAAWQLGCLGDLVPAGAQLELLRQPLQPNTLLLQLGDSCYLCPPPLQQQQLDAAAASMPAPASGPASLQASPLKLRLAHSATPTTIADASSGEATAVAAAEERGEGDAGASAGATRRFANLLASKLLRSTPSLPVSVGVQILQTAILCGGHTSPLPHPCVAPCPAGRTGLAGIRHAERPAAARQRCCLRLWLRGERAGSRSLLASSCPAGRCLRCCQRCFGTVVAPGDCRQCAGHLERRHCRGKCSCWRWRPCWQGAHPGCCVPMRDLAGGTPGQAAGPCASQPGAAGGAAAPAGAAAAVAAPGSSAGSAGG